MGATTRREPVRNAIPKAKAYQYYNMLDFKGIEISDNPFNTTTGSCSDCLNVYVDKEGSLTTRPRLEIMSELKNIVALQNATFIGVYGLVEGYLIHCTISNVNKFYRYVNNTLTAITDSNNLCPATRCKTFEQNDVIYILTGSNYLNIIDNDLSEVEGYVPTVRVGATENSDGNYLEEYNLLTNKYRKEYSWSFKNNISIPTKEIIKITTESFDGTKNKGFIEDDLNYHRSWAKPLYFFYDNSYIGYSYTNNADYINLYYVRYIQNENGTETRTVHQIICNLDNSQTYEEYSVNTKIVVSENEKYFTLEIPNIVSLEQDNYVSLFFIGKISDEPDIEDDVILTNYFHSEEHSSAIYNRMSENSKFTKNNNYFIETTNYYTIIYNTKTNTIVYDAPIYLTSDNTSVTTPNNIMGLGIDDDSEHLLFICEISNFDTKACKTTFSHLISNTTPNTRAINDWEVTIEPIDMIGYKNILYSYSKQKLLLSDLVFDVSNGNTTFLPYGDVTADCFYGNIDTGLYILPYKNTDNNVEFIIYTDVLNDPYKIIFMHLSDLKITDNIKLKTLHQPTDSMKYIHGRYNSYTDEFNFSAVLKTSNIESISPMHIIVKLRDNPKIFSDKKIAENNETYSKWQQRRAVFFNSLITARFFNQRWFTSGSHIFYTNNNDPTYIPMYNYDLLGDDGYEVTGLNVISDTGMVAYTSKQLSIITPVKDRGDGNWDYSFTETKNTTGNVAKGNTIVTSYSTLPLQIDYKGIFTIQQTENVVSEANVVTPITNAIMRKWMKESETSRNMIENTRTMNYLYWTYFLLDTGTNTKIYVLDNRTLSWFYWEIPIRVMDMYVEDEETVFFDYNGVKYVMKTEDINEHNNNEYNLRTYYDELPETNEIIHWHWYSQILPLGSINFSKQLVATTFILNDDENTDNYGLRYRFRGFRKTIYETDNRDIEGDLQYVRNKTVRSMFTRIQFLQILLSDKTDDLIGDYSRLRLVGLGFKYRLLEANRT